ncbi:MAG TPA: hypothetical protein VK471_01465 [Solirubrobacterales bacterium]|nr:hypothetical protein [Solirubrobacterales bacterium]
MAVVAMMAILWASASDAVAARTPSAAALLARVTRPGDELGLLGQSSGPFGPSRKETAAELKFTNRDGYRFSVVAFGQTVALSVSNGREDLRGRAVGRSSTTTYLAHGKATPTSIQASFGDRGRIDLRFRPSGRELHASRHAGCRRTSRSVVAKFGLFVGELRFRGEGGYTSAETHRLHGGTVDLAALLACRPDAKLPGLGGLSTPSQPSPGPIVGGTVLRLRGAGSSSPSVPTHPSRGPKRTTLLASLKLPLSRAVFGARMVGTGSARFLAAEEVTEGRIGILRLVSVSSPQSSFSFDDTLADAAVAPPTPFSGKGVFQQGPEGAESWAGSLVVSFLGAPKVPLTGSSFRARLTQSW